MWVSSVLWWRTCRRGGACPGLRGGITNIWRPQRKFSSVTDLMRTFSTGWYFYCFIWVVSRVKSEPQFLSLDKTSPRFLSVSSWWCLLRGSSWTTAQKHTSALGSMTSASSLRAAGRRRAASFTTWWWMGRRSQLQHSRAGPHWACSDLRETQGWGELLVFNHLDGFYDKHRLAGPCKYRIKINCWCC